MTLLLREVVAFVAGAGLWLAVLAVVGGTVAAAVFYLAERHVDARDALSAIAVGGLVAALAHRLGLDVWAPDVGGRPLPVVWAAVGAVVLAAGLTIRRSRTDT